MFPPFRDGPLEVRGDEWTNLTPVRNAKDLNTIVAARQCHRRLKLISTAIQNSTGLASFAAGLNFDRRTAAIACSVSPSGRPRTTRSRSHCRPHLPTRTRPRTLNSISASCFCVSRIWRTQTHFTDQSTRAVRRVHLMTVALNAWEQVVVLPIHSKF